MLPHEIQGNEFTKDVECPTAHSGAEAFSVIVDFLSMSLLAYLFSRRVARIQEWKSLRIGRWLILAIYTTSYLFIFSSSFIKNAFGLNNRPRACSSAATLCVILYFGSKICIYFFLVERAYLVRASGNRRIKDKVWLFNTCGMLLPYTGVAVLAIIYHVGRIEPDGRCLLWLQPISDIAVMTLDVCVSIYLTILFLIPLMSSYSFKRNQAHGLRRLAKRTLVGCVGTLVPTIGNMSIMLGLNGEWGWVCLLTCNIDILLSTIVLHWVTSDVDDKLEASNTRGTSRSDCHKCRSAGTDERCNNVEPTAVSRIYDISRAANDDEEEILAFARLSRPQTNTDATLKTSTTDERPMTPPQEDFRQSDITEVTLQVEHHVQSEPTLKQDGTVELGVYGQYNFSEFGVDMRSGETNSIKTV